MLFTCEQLDFVNNNTNCGGNSDRVLITYLAVLQW